MEFSCLSCSGGLALFGDQSLFCRAVDFRHVGGFDESLPIMEDVQLCIRYMHCSHLAVR